MSYSTNSESLTRQDIGIIKSKYAKIKLVLIIMIFIFGGFGFFAFYMMDEIMPLFIVGFFDFLIFLGMWYFSYMAKKDISSGIKQIVTGTIDQKKMKSSNTGSRHMSSSSTTSYYLILGDLEILVDQRDYDNYHAGQKVQIALSNSSKIVLGINLLEDVPGSGKDNINKQDNSKSTQFQSFMDDYNIVSMTDDELSYIVKMRNKRLIYVTLWSLSLGFLSYFIIFICVIILITGNIKDFTPMFVQTIRYSLIGLILLVILMVYLKRVIPLIRDSKENNKILRQGIINDKIQSNVRILNKNWRVTSSRGNYYYLIINGKFIQVDMQSFELMNQGDKVTIHQALHSKTLLCIENRRDHTIRATMVH